MIAFTTSRFTLRVAPYISLLPVLLLARQMRASKYRRLFRGPEPQNNKQQK